MKNNLIIGLMFLFLVGTVSACSCMAPGNPNSELDKSTVVFVGEVSSITTNNYNKNVNFAVLKSWKGSSYNASITTALDSAGCGFEFVVGKQYIVYAFGELSDLQVSSCSRTSLLSEATEDLEVLGGFDSMCKTLYWIDNENKNCGQKEFCGTYMYYGLHTFETRGACESAVNSNVKNVCSGNRPEMCTLQYDPVCGDDSVTYGNACGACANENVSYWIAGECKDKQFFNLSNGRKAEIKIMPETASEKAIDKLGELNFTIELKEFTRCNGFFSSCFGSQVVYELSSEKEGKIFGLFSSKGQVSVEIDAETGEILNQKKPWWSFLASGI